jgi:hypothetical protein
MTEVSRNYYKAVKRVVVEVVDDAGVAHNEEAFRPDGNCIGEMHEYKVGETYTCTEEGPAQVGTRGFQACSHPGAILLFQTKYTCADALLQVQFHGDIVVNTRDCVAGRSMTVCREITWDEAFANFGSGRRYRSKPIECKFDNDGKLHSTSGCPAKWADGKLEWYKHGLLHRNHEDDAPAVVSGAYMAWYTDGVLHRDNDRPAVLDNGIWEWYRHGALHRDNDAPARISSSYGKKEEWYKNGKLHRDGDLPAIIEPTKREWYHHGVLHRDGDKPAYEYDDVSAGKMHRVWYKDGKVHRDGDQPAIDDTCGDKQEWYSNGVQHRDGDKPALISHRSGLRVWFYHGKIHRDDDKPAVTSDRYEYKAWYTMGKLHREIDKPAVVSTVCMEWWLDGKRHRDGDEPAVLEKKPAFDDGHAASTSTWDCMEWWCDGKRHREGSDNPAVINSTYQMWYLHGELSREGFEGKCFDCVKHQDGTEVGFIEMWNLLEKEAGEKKFQTFCKGLDFRNSVTECVFATSCQKQWCTWCKAYAKSE